MSNIKLVPTTFIVTDGDTMIGTVVHASKNKWSAYRERPPYGYRRGFKNSNEAIKWLESDTPALSRRTR